MAMKSRRGVDRLGRSDPIRSFGVAATAVVALASLFLSTAAVWTRVVLFDSDRVANSVQDSLARPEISEGLARYLTTQVFEVVEFEQRAADVTPGRLQVLLPAVRAAVEEAVTNRMERVLASDQGRAIIGEAARRSHRVTLALLRGDSPPEGVTVDEDVIALNLLPLVAEGLSTAMERGLISDMAVPAVNPDGSISVQIRQFEAALDVELPPDFGQFVLYDRERAAQGHHTLQLAQRTLVYFNRATWIVVALTAVATVATIWFARRRLRAMALLALGAAVVLVLQRLLVEQVTKEASNLLIDPAARSLVAVVVTTLTSSLFAVITVIAWAGVAVAVVVSVLSRVTRRRSAALTDAPTV